jgi:tetratricopeptide (TPR) repeat protein
LSGWQARVVVEVPQPSAEAGVDTAAVRVLCQGQAKPDGSDYRVLDAAGRPLPFQLTFHDAARYSLIAFRADNPRQKYFVYFGNPQAVRAAEQVVLDPAPGSGPPKGAWVPRYGLVLETIQRPEGDNPKTVADLAKLIQGSKARHGARYQRRIADGYNPFGSSDYYISLYRGWIQVPKAGPYQFCTISNEASFSFLDGKELVHWPGRHTTERGARGEKNALVTLAAGLHYVEYYQEEVTLDQMAFLGWRPSGDPGAFSPIPEAVFTAPHAAAVVRYESPGAPLLRFEPVIADSVWPTERHEGQYTRCRFRVEKASGMPNGTTFRWEFGDGQTATGLEVAHIYLALGDYQVALSAQRPGGASTTRWPLSVYEIEHVTEQFPEGKLKDYATLAGQYDRTKLDATSLRELAYLLAENEEPARAIEVAKEFVQRFGDAKPLVLARVRRLMADCAIRQGNAGLDEAIANYQASLVKETPPVERLDVLARLIRLLGVERGLPDKAGAVLGQVEELWRGLKPDEETTAAYRRAVIAAGDVLLWHGKADGARDLYERAEVLSGQRIPMQVRAARVGSYPNAIREFIQTGNYGAALSLVERWDETFPTDKPKGHTFYWRGKLLARRGQHQDAARYLARAIGLATGAAFESEARWLLAQSLEQLERKEEARVELAKLVKLGAAGFSDEFTKKAQQLLRQPAREPPK